MDEHTAFPFIMAPPTYRQKHIPRNLFLHTLSSLVQSLSVLGASPHILTSGSTPAPFKEQIHQCSISSFKVGKDAMHQLDQLQRQLRDSQQTLL